MMRSSSIKLKLFICVAALMMLSGCCVLSTPVSGIGAQETRGEATPPFENNMANFRIEIYPIGANFNPHSAVPYVDLYQDGESKSLGEITVDLTTIKWDSEKQISGKLEYILNGKPVIFSVSKSLTDSSIVIKSKSRLWYGYPAQTLMLVTIPVDIVYNVVVLAGLAITLPIYYLVESINGS